MPFARTPLFPNPFPVTSGPAYPPPGSLTPARHIPNKPIPNARRNEALKKRGFMIPKTFGSTAMESNSAKPAIAPGVFLQRGKKLRLAKIRPERRRDDQFGVGYLPEQEIAHAHLAARADEQIRVGTIPRPKMLGDDLLVDVRRVELAALHFLADSADGIHDFNAAAVAQRHDQRQAIVLGKCRDGFLEMLLHVFRQAINLANDFEADVVLVQLRRLGLEIMDEIFH